MQESWTPSKDIFVITGYSSHRNKKNHWVIIPFKIPNKIFKYSFILTYHMTSKLSPKAIQVVFFKNNLQ